jgi:hypothetical protein
MFLRVCDVGNDDAIGKGSAANFDDVISARVFDQGSLHSEGTYARRRVLVDECAPAQNLVRTDFRTKNGMPLFVTKTLLCPPQSNGSAATTRRASSASITANAGTPLTSKLREQAETFSILLADVASAFDSGNHKKIAVASIHLFYDDCTDAKAGFMQAFNQSGALFFNLRYFVTKHIKQMQTAGSLVYLLGIVGLI